MQKERKNLDYTKINQEINERIKKFNGKPVEKSTTTKTKENEKEKD